MAEHSSTTPIQNSLSTLGNVVCSEYRKTAEIVLAHDADLAKGKDNDCDRTKLSLTVLNHQLIITLTGLAALEFHCYRPKRKAA